MRTAGIYLRWLGIVLGGILILAPRVFAYDFDTGEKNWEAWITCTADSQCVSIYDACQNWTAVNVKYKTAGEEYQNQLGTAVGCPAVKLQPDPKALCLQNKCHVKPAMGSKSAYTYSQQAYKQYLEVWGACSAAEDCIIIWGVCEGNVPVHINYGAEARTYFQNSAKLINCIGNDKAPADEHADCVQGKCVIK